MDFRNYIVAVAAGVTLMTLAGLARVFGELSVLQLLWLFGVGAPGAFLLTFYGMNQFQRWRKPQTGAAQATVDHLARLRSDGIHLLNRPVRSEDDVARFIHDQETWRQQVLAVLRSNFPEAVVLSFDRLGAVPAQRYGHTFNARHGHQLEMLTLRIEIIQRIVDRHSA